jgi:hypothetical protein
MAQSYPSLRVIKARKIIIKSNRPVHPGRRNFCSSMLTDGQEEAELNFFTAGASARCTLPNLTSFFIECSFQADTAQRESLYIRGSDRVSGSGGAGKILPTPQRCGHVYRPDTVSAAYCSLFGLLPCSENMGLGKIVRWLHVLHIVQNYRPVL